MQGIWPHFAHLVKTIGVIPALRVAAQTLVQLLRRGVEISPRRRQSETAAPALRGAPLQWDMTARNLIALRRQLLRNGATFNFIDTHTRLQTVISRSGNKPAEARVSVLIPAYDNAVELAMCLESIFSFPSNVHLTIIIGDDASPNVDLRGFSGLAGVKVVRHARNLGYVDNVNALAQLARSEFLVTLNQDTIVCPGWIDELLAEFERTPNCGVAGPRILDTNFKILEAGALLFRNADAAHRGRGCLADDPRFNYTATVDYVSGCALLTRRDTWQRLQGLNTELAPAYYDDVDYCLRLQESGLVVRYAPLSCVIHLEGTSMGKNEDDDSSLKRFQSINRQKVSKLYPYLETRGSIAGRPWPDTHAAAKSRAVCILESVPNPRRDGGAVDFVLFIEYLIELDYQVSLVFTSQVNAASTATWRATGVQCVQIDDDLVENLLQAAAVVISFGTTVGVELSRRGFSHHHWVHHTSDCATRRLEQMIDIEKQTPGMSHDSRRWFAGLPRDPAAMWTIERRLIERPRVSLLVSREDLEYCEKRGVEGNLQYFPILKGFAGPLNSSFRPPSEKTVSFVGSFFHSPNPDAVEYFLADIWPLIHQQVSDATFLIWGSNISAERSNEWSQIPNVHVRGWFANWDEVITSTRTFVSPLRFGAGMKHKVIQSILLGRPVIGTHQSFDGLDQSLIRPEFASDDSNEIASLVVATLISDGRWRQALDLTTEAVGNGFYRSAERERVSQLLQRVLE